MTIWILALLLLASLAGLGYRQGAVRVAFSLAGILIGALLAIPLAHPVRSLLSTAGVKNPIILWSVPPFVVFLILLVIFKVAGFIVHSKAEVHYKYQTGDLRLLLWERLNRRVGLCLGLVNGATYCILISWVIYVLSYWTYQMSTPESDPKSLRIINRMGADLGSTGMAKVASAIDHTESAYFETADMVGLIYHNPLLQARVARYPAFLGLAEQPQFQDIANDKQFTELQMQQAPVMQLFNYPKTQAIVDNPDLLKAIKAATIPNLQDLGSFLTNGISAKYGSEKLLGRWDFNVNGAIGLLRKARPNIGSREMAQIRNAISTSYGNASLVATPEQQAFLKDLPGGGAGNATPSSYQGQWQKSDGKYTFDFNIDGKQQQMTGEIHGNLLVVTGGPLGLAFDHED